MTTIRVHLEAARKDLDDHLAGYPASAANAVEHINAALLELDRSIGLAHGASAHGIVEPTRLVRDKAWA